MNISFEIAPSCGDDHNSLHLWFGDGTRITIGESLQALEDMIAQLQTIGLEISEHNSNEL